MIDIRICIERVAAKDFKEQMEVDGFGMLTDASGYAILSNSNKKYLLFFYYTTFGWRYLIPTDSHILGFSYFQKLHMEYILENK